MTRLFHECEALRLHAALKQCPAQSPALILMSCLSKLSLDLSPGAVTLLYLIPLCVVLPNSIHDKSIHLTAEDETMLEEKQ